MIALDSAYYKCFTQNTSGIVPLRPNNQQRSLFFGDFHAAVVAVEGDAEAVVVFVDQV